MICAINLQIANWIYSWAEHSPWITRKCCTSFYTQATWLMGHKSQLRIQINSSRIKRSKYTRLNTHSNRIKKTEIIRAAALVSEVMRRQITSLTHIHTYVRSSREYHKNMCAHSSRCWDVLNISTKNGQKARQIKTKITDFDHRHHTF